MKTIGYFGDSFCASSRRISWCQQLAKKTKRTAVHFGKPGGSVWDVFVEIERMIKDNTLPDTLFFCYTNPYRLYHRSLSLQVGSSAPNERLKDIYDAANRYYAYVQDKRHEDLRYRYSLQWFDQQVLKPLERKHEIIQMWSMDPRLISVTNMKINLGTGFFINESVCEYAYKHIGKGPDHVFNPKWENHLTDQGNSDFANHIFDKIKSYITFD